MKLTKTLFITFCIIGFSANALAGDWAVDAGTSESGNVSGQSYSGASTPYYYKAAADQLVFELPEIMDGDYSQLYIDFKRALEKKEKKLLTDAEVIKTITDLKLNL
ncbi:MAG: hypothetical protein HN482_11215 [Bdellovibrionales bacterium]|nr:hypothetical protein [Bdellovibrionales bacterium]